MASYDRQCPIKAPLITTWHYAICVVEPTIKTWSLGILEFYPNKSSSPILMLNFYLMKNVKMNIHKIILSIFNHTQFYNETTFIGVKSNDIL